MLKKNNKHRLRHNFTQAKNKCIAAVFRMVLRDFLFGQQIWLYLFSVYQINPSILALQTHNYVFKYNKHDLISLNLLKSIVE